MARYNKILLNGLIKTIKYIPDEENAEEIIVCLLAKNPNQRNLNFGLNEEGMDRYIPIRIRQPEYIDYLKNTETAEGDMMSVKGVFCTIPGQKSFVCPKCGEKTIVPHAVSSYIHPLYIQVYEHPESRKYHEYITLSKYDKYLPEEDKQKKIRSMQEHEGDIIKEYPVREMKDGSLLYQLVVRKPLKNRDLEKWFDYLGTPCNSAVLTGNVCGDPTFHPQDQEAGRVCTYQIGIRRKYFVKEDDPELISDFPWIRSLGDQAERDAVSIKKSSAITIEGYIQARNNFSRVLHCERCKEDFTAKDSAMEAVANKVSYDAKCEYDKDDAFNEINRASVNGRIEVIRYLPSKEDPDQIILGLSVRSKRKIATGNKSGSSKNHAALVSVTTQAHIDYLLNNQIETGDFIAAEGVLRSVSGEKKCICPTCGTENILEKITISYIDPESLLLYEHEHSRKTEEDIMVNDKERYYPREKIMEVLINRKKTEGDIIDVGEFVETGKDGSGIYHVITRKSLPDPDLIAWLEFVSESSNETVLIGKVKEEPEYSLFEKHDEKKCSYTVETRFSRVFEENNTSSDDAVVTSVDDQADIDHQAIRPGSGITVEGYNRFKNFDGKKIQCVSCGKIFTVKTYETETVPYSVEYNSGCNTIEGEEDLDVVYPE